MASICRTRLLLLTATTLSYIVNMTSNPVLHHEKRIVIRFSTTNIPGEPKDRLKRIADDFAELKLLRRFNSNSDYFHWPSDFDATTSIRVWMLCDFNIREEIPQVDAVPIEWWSVIYDNQKPVFIKRRVNGKHFTNRYPWGGRENEWKYRLDQKNMKGVERPIDNGRTVRLGLVKEG